MASSSSSSSSSSPHKKIKLISDHDNKEFTELPVIDISPLECAKEIFDACTKCGFFYIRNHGVDPALVKRLYELSRLFFKLDMAEKRKIEMKNGGRAWRGYFSVGEELTSGKPDQKEGIYFGKELSEEDELVKRNTPMHGQNLFPETPKELKEVTLQYFEEMTKLGETLMRGIALSLNLPVNYFKGGMCADPLCLFRIFNYPANPGENLWSVGEHNDYGLITILWQDDTGSSLQVQNRDNQWVLAPPIPDTFVINLGDMMELITFGLFRSTLHRVRNVAKVDRMSMPFFYDPGFHSIVKPIQLDSKLKKLQEEAREKNKSYIRWDYKSIEEVAKYINTYSDYVLAKVGKVFPDLASDNLNLQATTM